MNPIFVPCSACHRFVRASETQCPFCQSARTPEGPTHSSALPGSALVRAVALTASMVASACDPATASTALSGSALQAIQPASEKPESSQSSHLAQNTPRGAMPLAPVAAYGIAPAYGMPPDPHLMVQAYGGPPIRQPTPAPQTEIKNVQVSRRSTTFTAEVMTRQLKELTTFRTCYSLIAARNRAFAGEVLVQMNVLPNGSISNLVLSGPPELRSCIFRALPAVRFATRPRARTTVTFTVVFSIGN